MIKNYLFILFILIANLLNAQNTWFKDLSGWRALSNHLKGDTLITVCLGNIGSTFTININYSSYKSGFTYRTDTLDFFSISSDSARNIEYRTNRLSVIDPITNKLTIGFNYLDSVKGANKWQSAIFTTNPLRKLAYNLNHDTFDTKIEGYHKFGKNCYVIALYEKHFGSNGSSSNYKLLKLNNDSSVSVVKEQLNSNNCSNCHEIRFEKLHVDNQNSENLFLVMSDLWDWHGVPAQFQADVIKIDTNGKTLWKCRPNNRDSFNTSAFQMVQKPNGNLLCSWNDFYHPPHKHRNKDNPYEDINDSATIWFAEIDYITGAIIWRKNIRKYLFSQFTPPIIGDKKTHQDLFFQDAYIINNNSVGWFGHRTRGFPYPVGWKRLSGVLKTDLNGNPLWYNEHEIFPNDTGDKGLETYSSIKTPDGFILSGEYINYFGQASNGTFWQKAANLKLDSFGCFKLNCNTRNLKNILNKQLSCKVFPNPFNNKLNIQPPENYGQYSIKIISTANGQLIFETNAISDFIINSTKFSSGLYLIQLTNLESNKMEIHKVSVLH